VETQTARPAACTVALQGFGEVRPLNSVRIASEVQGRVTQVHPHLDTGEIITKGELLFAVDTRKYKAALQDAQAEFQRLGHVLKRLKHEERIASIRLRDFQRNQELLRKEMERYRTLLRESQAVSRSALEEHERIFNAAREETVAHRMEVSVFPLRIKETQSAMDAAQARCDMALTDLKRCTVRAPFTGRLQKVDIKIGQYVSEGTEVLTLADDSILEIIVPLDADKAFKWLRFTQGNETCGGFKRPFPTSCSVIWTASCDATRHQGRVHKIVRYNKQNRTLDVAVRLTNSQSKSPQALAEGMFCEVLIPGRSLDNVLRIPRRAISHDDTVRVAHNNRLKTQPVQIAYRDDDYAYVSSGLHPKDRIIVSPLADPLENCLLAEMPLDQEVNSISASSQDSPPPPHAELPATRGIMQKEIL
jgi:RND family efflux transporter MFP subunit